MKYKGVCVFANVRTGGTLLTEMLANSIKTKFNINTQNFYELFGSHKIFLPNQKQLLFKMPAGMITRPLYNNKPFHTPIDLDRLNFLEKTLNDGKIFPVFKIITAEITHHNHSKVKELIIENDEIKLSKYAMNLRILLRNIVEIDDNIKEYIKKLNYFTSNINPINSNVNVLKLENTQLMLSNIGQNYNDSLNHPIYSSSRMKNHADLIKNAKIIKKCNTYFTQKGGRISNKTNKRKLNRKMIRKTKKYSVKI